jgi:hypothetical protein
MLGVIYCSTQYSITKCSDGVKNGFSTFMDSMFWRVGHAIETLSYAILIAALP